jgi:cobalt transporter subunit CbtA
MPLTIHGTPSLSLAIDSLMFTRIFVAAVISGIVAGIAFTGLQAFKVMPLIWQAETFQSTSEKPVSGHSPGAPATNVHSHSDEGHYNWAPADGVERVAFTLLANVLIGIGFALLLCAAFALYGQVDWRQGIIWGLLGCTIFQLAPAFGLPPELPGMRSAPVNDRQIWWVAAIVATAGGLALIFLAKQGIWKAVGIALIALPHMIGAPHPHYDGPGVLPAELAASFVSASLITNLLFWLLLGVVSAWSYKYFSARTEAA